MSKTLTRLQAKVATFGAFLRKVGSGAMFAGGAMLAPIMALFTGMLAKSKEGVFGDKAQADAQAFSQAWTEALTAMQSALVPVLELVTPWMQQLSAWVKENKDLVRVVLIAGVALVSFGLAMKLAGIAIGGVAVLLGVLKLAVLAVLSPVGLVVAAIAGIATVFATQTEEGREATEEFKAGFLDTANTAKEAWKGAVAAFQAGDMELAMQIVGAALRLEWAKIDEFWTKKWVKFKNIFVDGWHELKAAVALIANAMGTGLELALSYALEGVIWLFNKTIGNLVKGAAWLLDKVGINETAKNLRDFSEIGTGWIDKWRDDVNRGHGEEEARIGKALADKLAANAAFRDAQVAAVEAATAAARGDFAALVARAVNAPQKDGHELDRYKKLQLGADAAKGAFQSPNFRQALGYSDTVSKQQLDVQKKMLVKLGDVEHAIEEKKGVVYA